MATSAMDWTRVVVVVAAAEVVVVVGAMVVVVVVVVEVVVVVGAVVVVGGGGLVVVGVGFVAPALGAVVVGVGLVVRVGLVDVELAGLVAEGEPPEPELDLRAGEVVGGPDPPGTTAPVGGDEPSWAAV